MGQTARRPPVGPCAQPRSFTGRYPHSLKKTCTMCHDTDRLSSLLPSLTELSSVRNLGFIIDQELNMKDHITKLRQSFYYQLRQIRTVRHSHHQPSKLWSMLSSARESISQQPSLWNKRLPPWPSQIAHKFGCTFDPQNWQIGTIRVRKVRNFLNSQLYVSAMISSQSALLLVILASSLILTCHSQIKLTPCLRLVIFISETSVVFVISFLFLQLYSACQFTRLQQTWLL